MRPRSVFYLFILISFLLVQPESLWAQSDWPAAIDTGDFGEPNATRGPGAYFAWYKLLLIAATYLVWVFMADRVNKDLLRWGPQMKLSPNTWNLSSVLCVLAGFWITISLPMFWIGYPFLFIAVFLPPFIYNLVRRSRIGADVELAFKVSGGKSGVSKEPLRQDEGVAFEFTPAGDNDEEQTANLIRARQSVAFVAMKDLLLLGITNRADVILLDFTQHSMAGKMLVDGAWHNLPQVDRVTGDAMLFSLKSLAGLNPAERRAQQMGRFKLKWPEMSLKTGFEIASSGVKTGERVQVKAMRAMAKDLTLSQVGMWPDMQTQLLAAVNRPGLTIISAPARTGLTTTWRSVLLAADRMTRDCMGLISETDAETELENLQIRRYQPGKMAVALRGMMLLQPDVVVVPDLLQAEVFDVIVADAASGDRAVIAKVNADGAAAALLMHYAKATNKQIFLKAIIAVTGQRLLRRLCDHCKQAVSVKPEAIQKLGGDPRKQNTIFNHYQLPPPEQRVDEKGQPVEMFPCPVCQGLGFIGRIAAIELLQVDDRLRSLILKQPQVDKLEQYGRSKGQLSLLQQAYRLVLAGVTSISEVQRVFSKGQG